MGELDPIPGLPEIPGLPAGEETTPGEPEPGPVEAQIVRHEGRIMDVRGAEDLRTRPWGSGDRAPPFTFEARHVTQTGFESLRDRSVAGGGDGVQSAPPDEEMLAEAQKRGLKATP